MIETPKMFPGRKFQLFNFIWRSNYFEQQNTDRHNSSNILIPCLYLSRGQNPCWQTTQKSNGGTFGPCKTVFGGGWIHWTGSNSFTRSATQRCFSPLLWFSNHSFSDRCTSQLSQLCSRFGPKIVAFCLLRQLSRRRAEDEALTYAKNWYRLVQTPRCYSHLTNGTHKFLLWISILLHLGHRTFMALINAAGIFDDDPMRMIGRWVRNTFRLPQI